MLPNQVLPTIPRQKVKNTNDERYAAIIGEVIKLVDSELLVDTPLGLRWWRIEDCEPVPEEPRPFRCGDCVVSRHGYDNAAIVGKIQAMNVTGTRFCIGGSWFDDIRFATPEERAKYF